MICPYCKKKISDSSCFCPGCGQSISQDTKSSNNTTQYWKEVTHNNETIEKLKKEELNRTEKIRKTKIRNIVIGLSSLFICVVGILFIIKQNMTYNSAVTSMVNKSTDVNVDTNISTNNEGEQDVVTDKQDYYANERTPFNQKYWIIFTEGSRSNRVEASTIDSSVSSDELYFIWDTSVDLNDTSGSQNCDQFRLTDTNDWEQIGEYGRLSDWASEIIASNLDVYDSSGNLICGKTLYQDIDWNEINSMNNEEDYYANERTPFKQKYWIIFTEGSRSNRVEASTIDSSVSSDKLYFIWDTSVTLNDTSGSQNCDQFRLTDTNDWEQIGEYGRLSDWASEIIASNLDVYDSSGNLICGKTLYQDIDWNEINSYQ